MCGFPYPIHFFAAFELSLVKKFGTVEISKYFSTVEENADKVLIFVPEIKALSVEEVVFEVSEVVLAFGKDLKSEAVSSPTFELSIV